jgi:hypothetical protein
MTRRERAREPLARGVHQRRGASDAATRARLAAARARAQVSTGELRRAVKRLHTGDEVRAQSRQCALTSRAIKGH